MRSDRTLTGTNQTITTGERVGTRTHWETFDGRTADGDVAAVRSLRGEVPEDEYDRFDSLATQWQNVSGRETVRTLVDWGTDPEPWVAVESVPGELKTLANGGSVETALECDLATRTDLLGDVCEAIRSYGRYGSTPYHLRIGPESVVFREDPSGPTAVVDDWGISGLVTDPPVTPYTAPEQFDDGNHAGRQTDVYRLGALGYHLLSGSPPFADADRPLEDAIRDGIGDDPAEIPEDFRRVLRDAMSIDPDDRQDGAYQFRRDLVDARPRVPREERVVSGLPPLDGKDDEHGGDLDGTEDTDTEEPSGEDGIDDEENVEDKSERADNERSSEEEGSADDREVSTADETTDDSDGDSSRSTRSSVKIGKYLLIGAVVLIVLVGGFFGASALGLIGGGGGGGGDTGPSTPFIIGSVVNANGEPIDSSVEVTIERVSDINGNETDGQTNTTVTDGGRFVFGNVPTGTYEVTVGSTGVFRYGTEEIEVDENGTNGTEIEPLSATVSGRVADAETGEPLSTDGDGGVDASIELVKNSETVDSTTGGSYEFTIDPSGDYTLRATADRYDPVERPIESFGEQEPIELEPLPSATLDGKISDTDGTAIANATVEVIVDPGEVYSSTSDLAGRYEITGIPPDGWYVVEIQADGYETISGDIRITGANSQELDIELEQSSSETAS
ncbi:Serine/threonine protein kinase [Halorubrum aquaticum]|uniref:Serine/threonine protein kinase n=1 Tax=Halorubrum aquaticum TaxID=387340 RepID=A0A1I3B3U5_9EURY|nr:carboxypeptidase regulatory-like domain-containing protein [Halorubrum aquaticum]SFH56619.1 Serine/threonine protein kinase [Halorubrum aquaticum]